MALSQSKTVRKTSHCQFKESPFEEEDEDVRALVFDDHTITTKLKATKSKSNYSVNNILNKVDLIRHRELSNSTETE